MVLKLEINTRFGRLKHHASVGESSCIQLMVDQCSHSDFGQLLVPACMDIGSGLKGEMDCMRVVADLSMQDYVFIYF